MEAHSHIEAQLDLSSHTTTTDGMVVSKIGTEPGDSLGLALGLVAFNYRPQRSCGQGNIFTPVCHSVHRGGVSASVHAGIPPPLEQTPPPGVDTPQEQTPPLGADTPQEQTPPEQTPTPLGVDTPHPPGADTPREADPGIRSMSSRYASYWNAFLFFFCFAWVLRCSFGVGSTLHIYAGDPLTHEQFRKNRSQTS